MVDRKIVMNIIKSIYDSYQTTENFTREQALGVNTDYIELDESYPYYDFGIRAIECESGSFSGYVNNNHSIYYSFNMYVDLSFLSSDVYSYVCDYISRVEKIIVISKTGDYKKHINFSKKLYFMVDMSDVHMYDTKYISTIFDFNQLNNFINSKLYYDLNAYSVYYDLKLSDNLSLEEHLLNFNTCFLKSDSNNLSLSNYVYEENYVYQKDGFIKVTLNLYNDGCTYEEVLNYLSNFMSKIDKNYNLKGFYSHLYINLVYDNDEFIMNKLRDIRDIDSEVLDYSDFQFLKPYKSRFNKLFINVVRSGINY